MAITWNKETIKGILQKPLGKTEGMNHRTFVLKAAIVLWHLQTEDEKQSNATTHQNGVGYNGADADFMGWFSGAAAKGMPLKDKHIEMAAKRLVKYAGQLAKNIKK
jgi:hypothetical protein